MTECDGILIFMDDVSTKKTNTTATKKTNTIIVTNVTSTASINCDSKNVRDCYILIQLWQFMTFHIKL